MTTPPAAAASSPSLVSWKGVDYSLRAFARIHATHPETELHIVGDGPEEQALRQLSRALGVAHAVTFHGRQAPESVRDLMGRCDVFLQHSLDHESGWTEGFGVSITEASASGLPVIVTNSGGIPDQVTEDFNGHLAPQRDVEAFARLMSALATDPARRRRLGQAGRARACQEFDAAKMAQRLEQRLLAAVHRRRPDASMASPMLSPVRASLA
jgi:colanic acid/amylovoran biosynthesis glycosyltransferase